MTSVADASVAASVALIVTPTATVAAATVALEEAARAGATIKGPTLPTTRNGDGLGLRYTVGGGDHLFFRPGLRDARYWSTLGPSFSLRLRSFFIIPLAMGAAQTVGEAAHAWRAPCTIIEQGAHTASRTSDILKSWMILLARGAAETVGEAAQAVSAHCTTFEEGAHSAPTNMASRKRRLACKFSTQSGRPAASRINAFCTNCRETRSTAGSLHSNLHHKETCVRLSHASMSPRAAFAVWLLETYTVAAIAAMGARRPRPAKVSRFVTMFEPFKSCSTTSSLDAGSVVGASATRWGGFALAARAAAEFMEATRAVEGSLRVQPPAAGKWLGNAHAAAMLPSRTTARTIVRECDAIRNVLAGSQRDTRHTRSCDVVQSSWTRSEVELKECTEEEGGKFPFGGTFGHFVW